MLFIFFPKGQKDYHNITPESYKPDISFLKTRQQTIQQKRHSISIPSYNQTSSLCNQTCISTPLSSVSGGRSPEILEKAFMADTFNMSNSTFVSVSSPEAYYISSSSSNNSFSARNDSPMHSNAIFKSPNTNNKNTSFGEMTKDRHIAFASPIANYKSFAPEKCASSVGRSPFSAKKTFPPEIYQATRFKNGRISAKNICTICKH